MATDENGNMLLFDSSAVRFKNFDKELKEHIKKFKQMTPQEQDEALGKEADEAVRLDKEAKEIIQKALKEAEAQKTKSPATK
mgnify:CR=1 FL=1